MTAGPGRFSRRTLLLCAGGAALAAGVGGTGLGSSELAAIVYGTDGARPDRLPFFGRTQPAVTAPAATTSALVAFDVVVPERERLVEGLQRVSQEVRRLIEGRAVEQRDRALPPVDTGVVTAEHPGGLGVVAAAGASLFDDRFGLADRRPRELVRMPFLANDRHDPNRTHGDLLFAVDAATPDVVHSVVRQIARAARRELSLRWTTSGWARPDAAPAPGRTDNRNLLGFKDGTANLDIRNPELVDANVVIGSGDGEPAWFDGGSYMAVRFIRLLVERWDRAPLAEQEAIIGRHKVSGAPLGKAREEERVDPGLLPPDAHVALAMPQAGEVRQLRRGFNVAGGADAAGQFEQALAFVSYQRSLERGFLAAQRRLAGEPLEEYTLVTGGGFFAALPGPREPDGWLGEQLFS